ncbi:class I SAM-dependent methyltransferase [Roseovarius sp. M141]|uniref:class I SAM-dependent methyltransferase n=1 Tax=Roseovarius sp. M141 TaxID=2583806 RepID=UPI0020CC3874|nr:class I SAM-dependent methyltransferase [Roseovarius sp. M141]MCQ0090235.1 class I SAM-dependent methyltransferase [Roseovarius sp. M141]
MTNSQDVPATHAFGSRVDFGKAASEYRAFRVGFPDEFFQTLADRGFARPGEYALDLGTGTGTIARGMARMGLQVTGIDPSHALLAEAALLDREASVEVAYRIGKAEQLVEADGSLNLITAGQCWHWFDRARVAHEAFRTLKSGGRIVIAHFDWLPYAGNVVEMTEKLILAHNPDWTMAGGFGIYPQWMRDLAEAQFTNLESFSFDTSVTYSHEAWRGRIRASAGVKASLPEAETKLFDADLSKLLRERFPTDPLSVPHRIWVATGSRP